MPIDLWTCSWDSLHDVVLKVSPISPGSPLASARTVGAFRTLVTRGAWVPWAPSLCVWSLTLNASYLTGGKWTVRATATEILLLLSFWLGATGSCIQAEDGPKCQCVVEKWRYDTNKWMENCTLPWCYHMASDVSTAKIEQTVLLHHRATKESQDLQRAGWQLMCRLKNLVYYIPFQEKERKRTKKGRKGRPQCTLALLKDESAKIEWQTICNPKIAYSLGGLVAIFPAPYDHQGRHASQNKLHGGAEENPAAATCGQKLLPWKLLLGVSEGWSPITLTKLQSWYWIGTSCKDKSKERSMSVLHLFVFKRVRASRSLRDSHSPICFYLTVWHL